MTDGDLGNPHISFSEMWGLLKGGSRATRKPAAQRREREISACQPEISRRGVLSLCVQRQAAAVRMFLSFFRLGILALEVGERHVQRFVPRRIWIVLAQDHST